MLRFILVDGVRNGLSFGGAILLCFGIVLRGFVVGTEFVWTDEFSLLGGGIGIRFCLRDSAHF